MIEKFLVRATGQHPVTCEPFSWYVINVSPEESAILGTRYRLHPTETGQLYSAIEAAEISASLLEKGILTVEIISVTMN